MGGKSTRFGSDKGIFEFLGKPLITYQLETLCQFNLNIFLIANSFEQIQNYINKIDLNKIMGFVLDDKLISKNIGVHSPMIGLYSAFKELLDLGYQKALTVSCDMPLIKKSVVELLIKESIYYDCIIPKWKNGFLEPLFAVYPIKEALFRIEYFL
ncbi:MAG TPA: molybdenum cofactor guanylyltransferase, partial [Candidatus Lokiarchaeia archaeon]